MRPVARSLLVAAALGAAPLWGQPVVVARPPWLPGAARAALRVDPRFVPSPALQRCLDDAVARLGLQGDVREGRFAAAVADLTADAAHPAYAGVADTRMMYGASVPKIATLGAAFQWRRDLRRGAVPRAEGGAAFIGAPVDFAPVYREQLRLMIFRSDNRAATEAAQRTGLPRIAVWLWDTGLYDPARGGGVWLGRGFFHDPLWRAEPMRNLPHAATARALVSFYTLLGQDRLVDADASAEIRALMGPSAFFNRLRRAVLERWPTARVYRKTGTWRQYRHDSALVERPGARYAVAALCGTWRCEAEVLAFGREADRCVGGGR
jgi:beta-lactamase class A